MAAGYRTYDQRTTGRRGNERSQFYVYGNAVRQAEPLPKRMPGAHPEQPEQHRPMSRQVAKNRHRAKSISPAYAVFLAVAAVCAVMVCMVYLSLQSEVVSRSEKVASMQEQLADLTEAHDTAYNAGADSVNLVTVRDRAMKELGMVPEAEGAVGEYDRRSGADVKQYGDSARS